LAFIDDVIFEPLLDVVIDDETISWVRRRVDVRLHWIGIRFDRSCISGLDGVGIKAEEVLCQKQIVRS
jgi:hypothetical protein